MNAVGPAPTEAAPGRYFAHIPRRPAKAAGEKSDAREFGSDLNGMQTTLKRTWSPKIGGDELKPSGVLDYLETLHQVKFFWAREDREKLAKKSVTVKVENRPLFHVLQSVLEQCDCHFAVLPNGDILVELKRPLEQFSK